MRRTLVPLLVGGVLLLAGWVSAAPASACSCAPTGTAEQFAAADTVFSGRLTSREVLGGSSSDDPAVHLFAVDAVQKGSASADQTVVSAASGASCGLELAGNGPFLVFATRDDDGVLRADLCGGTAELTPGLAAEVAGLGGPSTLPTEPEAALPAELGRGPLDQATADDGAPRSTTLALGVGAAVLAVLAGALVVRSRRRARRTTAALR